LKEGILKYTYRHGIQKVRNKFTQLSLVFLLAVTGMSGAAPLFGSHHASALTPHIDYTDVALSQSELDTHWSADRRAPSGGYNSVDFGARNNVAELRIDNANASPDSGFNRTEGIQRTIPESDAVKADLYVDSSWGTNLVRAGLWGVAQDSSHAISAYPIIEYTKNNSGFSGWRIWDDVNGTWTNMPSVAYNTDGWNKLEIVHNNGSSKFNLYINNELVSTNAGNDSINLNAVILNSFNSATGDHANDYAAHWSNFGYGNVTGASVSSCATTSSVFTTDLSTWNLGETRANGHNVIVPTGLHVYTDGNSQTGPRTDGGSGTWNTDKAAGYYPATFALSSLGDKSIAQSMDYQATDPGTPAAPGLQLVTDFDNNGTPDGILVGETVYGNNWWASSGPSQFVKDNAPTAGGGGSAWNGTINQWLSSFPDAKVLAIGYSLGSGVHGDGIIKKISLGCTDYTFGLAPPATPANLRLEDHNGAPIACGGYTNFNYITPKWDAVAGATSYNYKVTLPNGSTYGPTNVGNVTSVSGQFGGEGLSTFSVQAVNAGGQTSDWANSCAITYDPTAPAVPTLLTPPNNSYVPTNDFYFTWSNTSDSGSPVKYEFQSSLNNHTTGGVLDTGVWNNIANGSGGQENLTAPQIHSTGAPDGTWYWQVRAIDAAGNKSAWTSVWNVTIDTSGPVAPTNLSWKTSTNVVVPNNGTTNVADGTASWNASTSGDVDHYVYKYWNDIPGNQYKVGSEYTTNVNGTSLAGVFNQGEGVHHFCVAAVDHAGHQSACSDTFTITYDATGPTVTDNFTVNMGTGDKVTLNPTVTGDTPVTYAWSVSDSKLLTNPNESLTGSSLDIGPAPKGDYTATVKVKDHAGNTTTKTYNVTITPGNSNSNNAANNNTTTTTTQPQTLGASTTSGNSSQRTTAASTPTTGTSSSSTSSNSTGNGKVKGDSTTKPSTVNFANDSTSKDAKKASTNFLGLGWWWLPLVLVVLGLFWFFFGGRRQDRQA
jgi:hypothetical protein